MTAGASPSFGELLRRYRAAAGLTQEELATRTGLTPQAISLLERGERQHPQAYTVGTLVEALALTAPERLAFEAVARHQPTRAPDATMDTAVQPDSPRPAHNLPVALTSFIGRTREMAEVGELLKGTRLLTLTGTGGVGKTRLALQVARDLLGPYPDGVWLVELATLADPALVPQAVAGALGLREEAGQPLLGILLSHLTTRRVLLVLDNCEHLVAACAELVMALLRGCPQLCILATGREGLGVAGERLYRVPSLAAPLRDQVPPPEDLGGYAAVALFVARARERRAEFALGAQNARAVAQVCSRLDGMPLAIELAAARVGSLPVEAIASRLDDRFRLLTTGPRTALPRQQTLRAALDWSYDLLSEPEQRLLARLAVFAGGWTLEAAEVICAGEGIAPEEVLDLLAGLVSKSLVLLEEADGEGELGRYRLLETVRQYAWECLRGSDEEAARVRNRHLEWCVALAEQAEPELRGPEQRVWLERLEQEHDNLRAALAWGQQGARAGETCLRLAHALGRFWLMHSYPSEGRQWLAQALAAGAGEVTALRARAFRAAGHLALYQGDFPGARAGLEESLAICRELGDRKGMGDALSNLGYVASCQSDYQEAWARLVEGLALLREHGDRWGMGLALLDLGSVALYQGSYPAARPPLEEGLALFGELGDKWGISVALARLGIAALYQGCYPEARARLEESLALFGELGDKWGIGHALAHLGIAALYQGDYAEARARLEESLALVRERGDTWGIGHALTHLGLVALYQGDYAEARARLEESIGLVREHGAKQGVAEALLSLGSVAFRQSDYRQAGRLYAESLALCQTLGDKRLTAEALEGMAGVAAVHGQAQTAARLAGAADTLRAAIGAPVTPPRRADHERTVVAARTGMGEETFAAAWAAGQAMGLEEAITYALQQSAPAGPA